MKTFTPETTAIKSKRISNCALTYQQDVDDIMQSLVIAEQHKHLEPIIKNAAKALVDAGNKARLQRAARECLSTVFMALDAEYAPHEWDDGTMDSYPLTPPDQTYEGYQCDSEGNTLKEGKFVSHPEYYQIDYSNVPLPVFDPQLNKMQYAMNAANGSGVFKTAGVELVVTEDLLVHLGHTSS